MLAFLALIFSFKFWFIIILLFTSGYYIYQSRVKKSVSWFADLVTMMKSWNHYDRKQEKEKLLELNSNNSEEEEEEEEIIKPKRVPKISKGQAACHKAVEEIYGRPFKQNIRPSFLKNPETGHNLEIDVYNEDLKIGIEYQGAQHYIWPNFTKQTEDQFREQLRRDDYKKKVCAKEGIHLIIVPYTVKDKDIKNYILERLPSQTESSVVKSESVIKSEYSKTQSVMSEYIYGGVESLPYNSNSINDE